VAQTGNETEKRRRTVDDDEEEEEKKKNRRKMKKKKRKKTKPNQTQIPTESNHPEGNRKGDRG